MTAALTRNRVYDPLSPLAGFELSEVLSVLDDLDSPERSGLLEQLLRRLGSYDRTRRLETARDEMLQLVRSAPHELGMGMVSATEGCAPSCLVRQFWRHLVGEVLGHQLAFGAPPLH